MPVVEGALSGTARDAIRLLLVEDDDGDALLVEDLLAWTLPGALIMRSRTFAAALAELESAIDCVLLDLKLPDAEGLDTVTAIRARAPEVPLIVLTGLDDEAAGGAAVEAGAQDYLVKGSVEGDQLARAIRYAISRRQAQDAQQQLRLAEAQSREIIRLERGLAPRPLIGEGPLWIATRYRSGRDRALLGGDFFDAAEAPDGHLRVVIGDVCGHGPDEAAVGVCLRAAWRALAVAGVESGRVMQALERVLVHEREIPFLFTTMCTLEIESSRATARMVLAGHPAPILIDDSSSVSLLSPTTGESPIGLAHEAWSQTPISLPPSWAMLLYTDGITEARVDGGPERLGVEGLQELLRRYISTHPDWRQTPGGLLDELISRAEEINAGELADDVAMLLVGSGIQGS